MISRERAEDLIHEYYNAVKRIVLDNPMGEEREIVLKQIGDAYYNLLNALTSAD